MQNIVQGVSVSYVPTSGYRGYYPNHLEGMTFDTDLCRKELEEQARGLGIEHTQEELDVMVYVESLLW